MEIGKSPFYIDTIAAGEQASAYVPGLLAHLDLQTLEGIRSTALLSLGRLDAISTILPNPGLFLYMYVRKEALLSSQIEGTQSSLSDLLLHEAEEAPGVPIDDVEEVSNYIRAMNYGLEQLRTGQLPLSSRLLKEVHHRLLSGGRGKNKDPGRFRRIQNWLGGTGPSNAIFVPPPPKYIDDFMTDLEHFLHSDTPALVKAAVAHVQFETIHPFLDGNGRLGRLLVTLILCSEGILAQPLLYLSLWLKTHRSRYYELLQRTRSHGEWYEWTTFFLEGVTETAQTAVESAKRINTLIEADKKQMMRGKSTSSALLVLQAMQEHPVATIPHLVQKTQKAYGTVKSALDSLCKEGIVTTTDEQRYRRLYIYQGLLQILSEGAEPLT